MVFDRIRRAIEGKHRDEAVAEAERQGLTTEQVLEQRRARLRYKEETKRMEQMEYLKARRESKLKTARERGKLGFFGQVQRALPSAPRGKYSVPSMEEILGGRRSIQRIAPTTTRVRRKGKRKAARRVQRSQPVYNDMRIF